MLKDALALVHFGAIDVVARRPRAAFRRATREPSFSRSARPVIFPLMKRRLLLGFLGWVWLLSGLPAVAEITVYYVRHAEGGHNAKRKYRDAKISRKEWPSWVGNPNIFTPEGVLQVEALATNLHPRRFDFIAVSPLWRTRNTILPYLKATGQVAEIWPELSEVPRCKERSFPTEPPRAGLFDRGAPIVLPKAEKPYFRFRADNFGRTACVASNYADAYAMAKATEALLHERFGTNSVTVLLVGHGNAGRVLIRTLTRDPAHPEANMKNTHLWLAREKAGGGFELLRYDAEALALAAESVSPAEKP